MSHYHSTIFIILIGVFHLKEKLTSLDILGIVIAIAGAMVINYGNGTYTSFGLFIALTAALFIALHQTTAKMFVKKVHPLNLVNLRTLFSSSFLFIFVLATSSLEVPPQNTYVWFVAGGVVASIGFLFFYKSLELIAVSKAAIIRTLDPFIVVLYSIVIFRILPNLQEILGGSLIILGSWAISLAIKGTVDQLQQGLP